MSEPETAEREYGVFFTNEPLPTVGELLKFLEGYSPDQKVWAYEGEGGSSINIEGRLPNDGRAKV